MGRLATVPKADALAVQKESEVPLADPAIASDDAKARLVMEAHRHDAGALEAALARPRREAVQGESEVTG
jgi:hypothetical protein